MRPRWINSSAELYNVSFPDNLHIIVVRRRSNFMCTPTMAQCIFVTFELPLFTGRADICLAATAPSQRKLKTRRLHVVHLPGDACVYLCCQMGQMFPEEAQSLVTICEAKRAKKIYRWEMFIFFSRVTT